MEKHTHRQDDVKCFQIQEVRRFLVKFDETGGLMIRLIGDGLALVELEKCGGINLS
jgi:hypothetical protein